MFQIHSHSILGVPCLGFELKALDTWYTLNPKPRTMQTVDAKNLHDRSILYYHLHSPGIRYFGSFMQEFSYSPEYSIWGVQLVGNLTLRTNVSWPPNNHM